jgi:hypothetical protein
MSNGIVYNPIPPRVWPRVQNSCSTNQNNTNIANDIVYIPLTKQYVTPAQAQMQAQMLQKGNILQYKKNSANLTKSQKYSRISQGFASTRRKCYATQSVTYTNPNTSSLLRVNYTNIPYPNDIVGQPNNPSGPYQPNVPNPFDCSSNLLQDGGNLVCNAIVNPCTGQIIEQFQSYQKCYLSTCSDVPGTPVELCWYPGTQTWYPRNRYTMNNSLDKWPEGYKAFVSAVTPVPPNLTVSTNATNTEAILLWTTVITNALPISNYRVYQNGAIIETVSYEVTTLTLTNLTPYETYTFYVVAISGTLTSKVLVSEPSNTVSVYLVPITITITPPPEATRNDCELYSDSDSVSSILSEQEEAGLLMNGGYFIIQTPPDNNTITLPECVTNYNSITIYNKTQVTLTIQSPYTIYNTFYAPNGTTSFIIEVNQTGTFTYIYTTNGVTIQATLN